MPKIIAMLAPLILAWPAVTVPSQEVSLKETAQVASTALSTFRQLAEQQKNFREMGFASIDEMRKATLGEPFQVFMVRLDELGQYREGQDPGKLLHARNELVYPVMVGDQTRSAITLASTRKGWEATSFGGTNKVQLLSAARVASREKTRLPAAAYFVIEVPGLNLAFVGHRLDEVLLLTPILDDAGFRFQSGVTIAAAKVFVTIAPAARGRADVPK